MEKVAPCGACDVCLGEADRIGKEPLVSTPEPLTPAIGRDLTLPGAAASVQTPVGAGVDQALFERLRSWRGEQARRQQVPAYVVLHNSHLEEIAARKPQSIHELGSIKGVGLRRAARYGEELLGLVRGEGAAPEHNAIEPGYRSHLEAADHLLRSERGADAIPELVRALEIGG